MQGVEYGTDEEEEDEEEVSPPYPSAIEVFDLGENEDLSPLETDPEKLTHKYKEVRGRQTVAKYKYTAFVRYLYFAGSVSFSSTFFTLTSWFLNGPQ